MSLSKKRDKIEVPKNKVVDLNYDDYQPQPIKWKKAIITFTVISSIITTIILVWGLTFGGFYFRGYREVGQDAYDKIFTSSSHSEAIDSLETIDFWNEGVKQDATDVIDFIYNNTFDYLNPEISADVTDYTYSYRFGNMAAKLSNHDYIFHYDDFENLGVQTPNVAEKYPKYLSRQVLIRIKDEKIAFIAFQTSGDATAGDPIDYLNNGYTDGLGTDWD